ncbi:MliC family protein [Sphingomonas jeddahensis]|uniref:MliC family protein n=1 Tax=Sphingomonas jeddahensis TaxID=1915074 RepID=UPI0009F926E6
MANAARAAQQSVGNYAAEQEPTSPVTAPTTPGRIVATYRCDDSTGFRAIFDNQRDTATLALAATTVRLAGQRPASGIWYAGEGHELRGKGKVATLTRPGNPPLTCHAAD